MPPDRAPWPIRRPRCIGGPTPASSGSGATCRWTLASIQSLPGSPARWQTLYSNPVRRLLTDTQLQHYFARVGFRGGGDASLHTLRALHRAHLLAIPYENLDIHLGRRLTLEPEAIFDKLVDERRGGWCFEMNGL